jgi:antitoxin ParD1/3/4
MNVSLTKELEDFVSRKIESGRYLSASEVVRAGLRLLEHEDELLELQRKELREAIAKGVAQLDKGQGVPGKAAFDKARKNLRARRSPGK